MERLQAVATGITRVGAIAGGALLLLASIVICIDVALRYTVAWTVGGADDLAGYALAIASAWGFSAALLTRSHIRIDTVYVRVRRSLRATLDVVSLGSFIFFIGLVTMHAWGVLEQSYRSEPGPCPKSRCLSSCRRASGSQGSRGSCRSRSCSW